MSEIKVDTLTGKTTAKTVTVTVGATATMSLEQGLAKAWFNLNGNAATPAFRDSFALSSVTDGGTGLFTPVLSTAFANANWAMPMAAGSNAGDQINASNDDITRTTTGGSRINCTRSTSDVFNDAKIVEASYFGDLA